MSAVRRPPAWRPRRLRRGEVPRPPGPGPVPPAVLRSLDLAVRRRVEGLMPGEHRTPQVGAGIELATIRPYRPGDDVRHIDWNVTARMQEPHVRVHVGERALVTWLVLDASASMDFGTADRRKADVAEGVALALGHIGARRGNRLGLVAFGSGGVRVRRPRAGRAGLLALLAELRDGLVPDVPAAGAHPAATPDLGDRAPASAAGDAPVAASDLASALRGVDALARQRGMVAVVSDFRGGTGWEAPLTRLHARHGVIAVEIRDPREQELVPAGDLWLVDPETGRRLRVDTSSSRVRKRFAEAAAAEREEVAAALRRARADHVVLSTRGDWLRDLALHLRRPGR